MVGLAGVAELRAGGGAASRFTPAVSAIPEVIGHGSAKDASWGATIRINAASYARTHPEGEGP